ncbi:MAG: hypothetical protein EHM58_02555 [Ignavibacteriae bacterium]|nr:MAG: hypothetical protein EHM58_02555 [Ignavibacteriota bacterium]
MNIEYKKVIKVDELAHLVPTKAGATFSQLWQVFYYTRMLKYVSYRHYGLIKKSFNKICTYRKLEELCHLGYLHSPQHEVYTASNKVLPILKEAGYVTELLPDEPKGKGNVNEIHNSDEFVNALKLPHFHSLLYPNFGYLIPDALLVLQDIENKKYKLTFLEIEAKKPDWNNYIEKKRSNYLQLAHDMTFYNYWTKICSVLNLNVPDQKALKFSVCFIGTIKKDFGKGFTFVEHIW